MKASVTTVLGLFLASCAVAGAQISLTAEATGSGGRQTGSVFVSNGTVGLGGLSTGATYTLKSGFAGQVYDLAALSIASSSSTTMDEGAYAILTPTVYADDGSVLAVATNDVAWSPDNDVFEYFQPGWYLSKAVYQDTAGAVTGSYLGLLGVLGLTVHDNDFDNYSTAPYNFAFDGIPDSWQVTNFPAGSTNAAPTADPDGDGSSVMAEYFFNTDPNSATSSPDKSIQPMMVTISNQIYFAASIYHRASTPPLEFAPLIATNVTASAWTGSSVLVSTTTNGSGMATDIWRDVVSSTNGGSRFLRVFMQPSQD